MRSRYCPCVCVSLYVCLCIPPLSLLGNGSVKVSLSLLGNGSVKIPTSCVYYEITLLSVCLCQHICFVFYAVRVVSKDSRRLVPLRTSCYFTYLV
jgi:energy-converting hydrogenase Eha subunit C